MRRFLKKIFTFLLPLLIGGILMEVALRCIPNDYRNKRKYLDAHAHKVETLILGSSHALYGLNPRYLSTPAFNAANVSQSLDEDLAILEKYAGDWQVLKTVILPISYFTLFERLSEGPESWRIKNYVIYYDMRVSRSPVDYTEVLSNRFNVNCERIVSHYIQHKPSLACDSLGWDTLHTAAPVEDLVAAGTASAALHTIPDRQTKQNQRIQHHNLRVLERIADWCADRGIKLILFTPPAFQSYRENLDAEQLRISIQTATELAAAHPQISYYNFVFDPAFQENDFFDGDHLSASGAAKFTRIMDSVLSRVAGKPGR